jgi:Flp pilus assembly pilin Flp
MSKITGLWDGPYGNYVRVLLHARLAELRKHAARRDVGASAIELAIITAIIGMVALALALVIQNVVTSKKSIISGL